MMMDPGHGPAYVELGIPWDINLNQSGFGGNNNKFYIIKIVNTGGGKYTFFSRWGRVGDEGQHMAVPNLNLEDARDRFEKKFTQKTGNDWHTVKADRSSFEAQPGKYSLLAIQSASSRSESGFGFGAAPPSIAHQDGGFGGGHSGGSVGFGAPTHPPPAMPEGGSFGAAPPNLSAGDAAGFGGVSPAFNEGFRSAPERINRILLPPRHSVLPKFQASQHAGLCAVLDAADMSSMGGLRTIGKMKQ